jgi:hypothetical protein
MKPTPKQRTHIDAATANTTNSGIDTPDSPRQYRRNAGVP